MRINNMSFGFGGWQELRGIFVKNRMSHLLCCLLCVLLLLIFTDLELSILACECNLVRPVNQPNTNYIMSKGMCLKPITEIIQTEYTHIPRSVLISMIFTEMMVK